MTWLIAGLVLFLGAHSVQIFARRGSEAVIERLGEGPWKGLYSLASLVGFALIIFGYSQARIAAPLYAFPPALAHLTFGLVWFGFICVVAAYWPAISTLEATAWVAIRVGLTVSVYVFVPTAFTPGLAAWVAVITLVPVAAALITPEELTVAVEVVPLACVISPPAGILDVAALVSGAPPKSALAAVGLVNVSVGVGSAQHAIGEIATTRNAMAAAINFMRAIRAVRGRGCCMPLVKLIKLLKTDRFNLGYPH